MAHAEKSSYTVSLFYSYSHRDSHHKVSLEKALGLLKQNGYLVDWSDQSILPGRNISAAVKSKMATADVIVFLLSPDFIASEECMKEWERARQLSLNNPMLFRIPIVVRACAWKDLLNDDDIKALPRDGKPITSFSDSDEGWQQVYEGIKAVVDEVRTTFSPKPQFLTDIGRTDFISQQRVELKEIFVFLTLLCRSSQESATEKPIERITNIEDLLHKKYALIHGEDRSGKSALGRYIFFTLAEQSRPVLHLDLMGAPQIPATVLFKQAYEAQFHGDYALWVQQTNKTLIVDNLSGRPHLIELIVAAREIFDRIIVTLSSSTFNAFFRDESRLADFEELEITHLTQVQQETLIKKRLALTVEYTKFTDSDVDRIEDRVNSIILKERVVPRYPFFVLCILQTFEAYMPANLAITSYGHCYYALIVASLVRAGISRQDSDMNSCFNFAEHLAYEAYLRKQDKESPELDLDEFIEAYRRDYYISQANISRLKHYEFGLIDELGQFRIPYMHYFFLGRFLSRGGPNQIEVIQRMCDETHIPENFLTLLFTVHHTNDPGIIDDILLRTMDTLSDVPAATLDREETRRFREVVAALPQSILSAESVEAERRREREALDATESPRKDGGNSANRESEVHEAVNGIYRVLKNNEIMGQILRNKYGSITRQKIEEIVDIMADGGLRLVNAFLKDEQEITQQAQFIGAKNSSHDIGEIRSGLMLFSFLWTMISVRHIVESINVPDIRPSIHKVVERGATPAHDIIGYFAMLHTAEALGKHERDELERLLKKHEDPFVKGVLSLRTQHYMNTHRSDFRVEQSICSILGIKYLPRLVLGD